MHSLPHLLRPALWFQESPPSAAVLMNLHPCYWTFLPQNFQYMKTWFTARMEIYFWLKPSISCPNKAQYQERPFELAHPSRLWPAPLQVGHHLELTNPQACHTGKNTSYSPGGAALASEKCEWIWCIPLNSRGTFQSNFVHRYRCTHLCACVWIMAYAVTNRVNLAFKLC